MFNQILVFILISVYPACFAAPIKHFSCTGNAEIKIFGHHFDEPNLLRLDDESLRTQNDTNLSVDDDVVSIAGGTWNFVAPDHALSNFAVLGNCHVVAKNWNGTIRNINIESTSDTFLEGFYHIDNIHQNGKGRFMVYWIDDHQDLKVELSSGKMFLAGDVKNLVLSLNQDADFDGRQLRAFKLLAKSDNQSKAVLHPLAKLSVFAKDTSQVTYTTAIRHPNINNFDQASVYLEPLVEPKSEPKS